MLSQPATRFQDNLYRVSDTMKSFFSTEKIKATDLTGEVPIESVNTGFGIVACHSLFDTVKLNGSFFPIFQIGEAGGAKFSDRWIVRSETPIDKEMHINMEWCDLDDGRIDVVEVEMPPPNLSFRIFTKKGDFSLKKEKEAWVASFKYHPRNGSMEYDGGTA